MPARKRPKRVKKNYRIPEDILQEAEVYAEANRTNVTALIVKGLLLQGFGQSKKEEEEHGTPRASQ